MKWQHIIKNGQVYMAGQFLKTDIYIQDGKIAALSTETLGEADLVTDAQGLMVLPGLMDTHVHSRDPQATHKEDFYHSTLAAAMGGITCIFEMPNSNPPISNIENLNKQIDNLSKKANVDFALWGLCVGDLNKDDISRLNDAGVIGFKFFWGYAVNKHDFSLVYNYKEGDPDVIPPLSDGEVLDIFKAVKPTGKCLAIHAENSEIMSRLSEQVKQEGRNDYQALLDGRPALAEAATVGLGLLFAQYTNAHLHVLHVSAKESVELIRIAKARHIPVTAETCPHYLFLTDQDFKRVGNQMKVYPPVKQQQDQDGLWEGIADGTLTSVCSDHAPHTAKEKEGNLFEIPAGTCGVETLVPLMLNAVNEGRISMEQLIALMAENPAKQFNLYPKKGAIQIGSDADFTLVDMNKEARLSKENLHSVSKITPFDGIRVKGMPVATIVRGQLVVKDGQLVNEKRGVFLKPLSA